MEEIGKIEQESLRNFSESLRTSLQEELQMLENDIQKARKINKKELMAMLRETKEARESVKMHRICWAQILLGILTGVGAMMLWLWIYAVQTQKGLWVQILHK